MRFPSRSSCDLLIYLPAIRYTTLSSSSAFFCIKYEPMDYSGIITMEPGKRGGKPCIRGLRVTVYDVLENLASE